MDTQNVLSLLIRDSDQPSQLLMGIRSPDVNERHPNVLSTITQRIPAITLKSFETGEVEVGHTGDRTLLAFTVEALLARKLNVADELERGELHGHARVMSVTTGMVGDPQGTETVENTTMTNVMVVFDRGARRIPSRTTSYSRLAWIETAELPAAVRNRDALRLIPDANPFEVCLHGLCVRSAVTILS
jgi:hypothetical protein